MDVGFNFRTAYLLPTGFLEVRFKYIARKYLKSWCGGRDTIRFYLGSSGACLDKALVVCIHSNATETSERCAAFFRRFVVDIVASLPLTYLTLIYSLAAEDSNQPAGNLSFAKTLRMVQNAFLEPFIYYI